MGVVEIGTGEVGVGVGRVHGVDFGFVVVAVQVDAVDDFLEGASQLIFINYRIRGGSTVSLRMISIAIIALLSIIDYRTDSSIKVTINGHDELRSVQWVM